MTTLLKIDELLVSRQDPTTRTYSPVGTLAFDGAAYTFRYDKSVKRALPGLPLGTIHRSEILFPIFAERVIDPHRPERAEVLEQLGLAHDAGPFQVLAVSGGSRTGDTYELTPLPHPGPVDLPFLVHGIRHLSPDEIARIDLLKAGDPLGLVKEPENPVNDRAILVTADGARLGYVPDPLVGYVHDIMSREHRLVVDQVNPPSAGLHMRLLVRLTGRFEH